jgi:hypothetical protein
MHWCVTCVFEGEGGAPVGWGWFASTDDVVLPRYATRDHVFFVMHCHVVSAGLALVSVWTVPSAVVLGVIF